MRFLLKRVVGVGKNRATAKKRLDTSTKAAQSQSWGQQCGISCGCVLRIETQLLESSTSVSPTIVSATYHAKRVLATSNNNDNNGGIYLKPLTTQHKSNNSQPILSSCTTCPTLHQLATQTVEYLPGKTLDQVRNHIENGIATTRSSFALRHTILRENILPAIEEEKKKKKKLGTAKKSSSIQQLKNHEDNTKKNGRHEMMKRTNQYIHCYDLVEDALSSMIHERMPSPRSNINRDADFYSITLGSYFAMYDTSNSKRRRRRHIDSIDYLKRPDNDIDEKEEKLSAQANDWQRESPSSVFLFGDEHVVQSNNNTMSGYIYQYIKESINNQFGNEKTIGGENRSEQIEAPTTTYLQLLDMYSEVDVDDDDTQKDAKDDWLMHVDQMTTTA